MEFRSQGLECVSDANALFIEARNQFLDSISEQERAQFSQCSSADAVLEHLKGLESFQNDNRRATAVFRRIKSFSDYLEPYFQALDVIVQSHPEWCAIAWGALRLILRVS
jgi:hypothetical protein